MTCFAVVLLVVTPSCVPLDDDLLTILSPTGDATIPAGGVHVSLRLSGCAEPSTLSVHLDTADVTDSFSANEEQVFTGVIKDVPAGLHLLVARVDSSADEGCPASFDGDFTVFRAGQPPELSITLNEIPQSMNGTRPVRHHGGTPGDEPAARADDYDRQFRLPAPSYGFTIDLEYSAAGLASVDASSLRLRSARALGDGRAPAGADLHEYFVAGCKSASWMVPESVAFPTGTNLVCASIADSRGLRCGDIEYRFDVHPAGDTLLPFEGRDYWLLDFERDQWTTTWYREQSSRDIVIESEPSANGTPDFDEALQIMGLRGMESAPGASSVVRGGHTGANAIVRHMLMESIRGKLRRFYDIEPGGERDVDSINIDFVLTTDPEAPDTTQAALEEGYSAISIGGDNSYWYGRAELDWNNRVANDLTTKNYGVFVTHGLRTVINMPPARAFLALFLPGTGTPVGDCRVDATILSENFRRVSSLNPVANVRHDALMTALDLMSHALASAAAHEIGHSIGLVPDGFPPHGLFGNETRAAFAGPRTNTSHLDTRGNNIMAAGVHGEDAWRMLDPRPPRFNRMNLAYLRGRLLYSQDLGPSYFEEASGVDLAPEEQYETMAGQPGSNVDYELSVTNEFESEAVVELELAYDLPVSSPLSAQLNETQLILAPHGTHKVTLAAFCNGFPGTDVFVVYVGARAPVPKRRKSTVVDEVAAITFVGAGWEE